MSSGDKKDRLVAVIMAVGTLGDRFYPATEDTPLALLPVANNPLIFYSIEWLRCNKVDETIIYCNQNDAEDISEYCEKWSSGNGDQMKLMVVGSDPSSSLGDALRDLYNKSLLKNDFILLNGFVAGNINLQKVLRRHKASVKEDPNCIMTCLFQKRVGLPGIKPRNLDNVRIAHILVNSVTSKILDLYQPVKPAKQRLPTRLFCSSPTVRIWPVEDPNLLICSEKVPTLCLGNLDFDTRDSIIQSVLHYELDLKYYLKAYISKKGFMLQVTSFRAFEELSKLLVKRLLYPLVPEINLLTRRIWYKYDEAHRIYYAESAIFHKNYLGNENVIGAESEIDKECKMNNTVVGERCIIRGDVTICDSFLMDDVTIGNGCVVKNCFLGNNVKLFPGVNLDYGVIMGPNTKLGPSVKVYPYRRLVCIPPEVECKKEDFFMPFIPGSKGQAFEVTVDDGIKPQKDLDGFGFEDLKWGEYPQVRECLPIITDNKFDKIEDLEPHLALDFSSDEDKEKEFGEKVMNTLLNAYKDGSSLRPIMLELHTSFHTYNITEENVLRVMVKTILHVVEKAQADRESREVVNKLQCVGKGLLYFEDFIRKYVKNLKHQIIILNLLEELADEEPQYITIMQDIIQQLNQELEILDDEVIIYWYRNGGHKTSKFPIIAKKIKKHVEWLEDVSEEEDNIE